MWTVWSASEAQRCCKDACFLYCLGYFNVKYWPYKSYKSSHTCPTVSLRMSILLSLILYLKSRTFKGANSVHLTHKLWCFLLCHVERAASSRSAQEWNACASKWQNQQVLCKTALNLLTRACLHGFLVEPHISPNDLFDIFLVSLLQEHFSSEVPYSAEQTWHLIKLTYLVCIYTCRL